MKPLPPPLLTPSHSASLIWRSAGGSASRTALGSAYKPRLRAPVNNRSCSCMPLVGPRAAVCSSELFSVFLQHRAQHVVNNLRISPYTQPRRHLACFWYFKQNTIIVTAKITSMMSMTYEFQDE